MNKLLYGVAYYDEYMPCDRLAKDVEMMKAAGINLVRIAESTWSTCEPQEGVFDFSHVIRVLDAMEEAGISVIIGTPTYAIPTWMVKSHPDVLATTKKGPGIYGARQIMDITHPVYRYYGERVIRKLMEVSAHRKCVIGFQLDNETKYYDTAGKNVQEQFVKYLRTKFNDDLDAMNQAFGLDYWSNRINAWEDFPDVRGTINGSLGAEFQKFQRTLVDDYLQWQADIVKEYAREDQFITHNFDFDWRGYSYGVQPMVDQKHAARALTVAGVDIYHPTQDELTGAEISYGGDSTRSLKADNYFVLETEAAMIFKWILSDTGIVNTVLRFFGAEGFNWFGSTKTAMIAVVIVSIWQGFGYNMVIFISGLLSVPKSLTEAAKIDGANAIQIFFKITLPAMSPSIFFAVVMTVISSFQVFDQTFVSTMGGPNNETNTMVLYLYNNAFKYQRLGYASAIAWVLFFCMLIITGILMKQQKRLVNYDS